MDFGGNGVFTEHEWNELVVQLALSPRQAEITTLLLHGCADKQIARALEMSHHTLRTHMGRMFTKLDVQDRCELIAHVFREFRSGCNPDTCPRHQ